MFSKNVAEAITRIKKKTRCVRLELFDISQSNIINLEIKSHQFSLPFIQQFFLDNP
jgi:hypothetical protein